MLLLLRKQGLFESARIKRGKEKLPLLQHPLWQPEFPGRMVKMKNSGNAPAVMWSSACFSASRAAFLYSVLEVLIFFENPASQVSSLLSKTGFESKEYVRNET